MFIFDCECHMLPLAQNLPHFSLYKANQCPLHTLATPIEPLTVHGIKEVGSVTGIFAEKMCRPDIKDGESADTLIQKMDESGVAITCVLPESFLPITNRGRMLSTNGWVAKETRYPDRFVGGYITQVP
jgi:hypothetical protein